MPLPADTQCLYVYAVKEYPVSSNSSECRHPLGVQWNIHFLMQYLQYFGRRHPLALFPRFRHAEITEKELLFRRILLKFAVRLRHDILVRIIKPVTLTVRQLVHGLCIQLIVVYGTRGINHPFTSMQMKRRLPEGSVSKSLWLLVAMNEA